MYSLIYSQVFINRIKYFFWGFTVLKENTAVENVVILKQYSN